MNFELELKLLVIRFSSISDTTLKEFKIIKKRKKNF